MLQGKNPSPNLLGPAGRGPTRDMGLVGAPSLQIYLEAPSRPSFSPGGETLALEEA